jgi:SPP1 family predicted phage head-tail adaptor
MSIEAGRLRHKIEIQYPSQQQLDTGEIVFTWDKFAGPIWAAFEPVSAREFMAGNAIQSEIVARFVIRYREGLTANMRIVHKGKFYNIAGILTDKDSGLEYITLPVTNGVNDG